MKIIIGLPLSNPSSFLLNVNTSEHLTLGRTPVCVRAAFLRDKCEGGCLLLVARFRRLHHSSLLLKNTFSILQLHTVLYLHKKKPLLNVCERDGCQFLVSEMCGCKLLYTSVSVVIWMAGSQHGPKQQGNTLQS